MDDGLVAQLADFSKNEAFAADENDVREGVSESFKAVDRLGTVWQLHCTVFQQNVVFVPQLEVIEFVHSLL